LEKSVTPDASFSYYFDDDGFLVFRGRLPPDEGELLVKAIEAMQLQILEDNQNDVSAETFVEKGKDNDDSNVSAETFTQITELGELNQREGLDINHETAASHWQGDQMDYDYSVAAMFELDVRVR
jgi:hypothetical protein